MTTRPIVIVDPRSSGVELAPAFATRGIPAIGITLKPLKDRLGYGTDVQTSDFVKIFPEQPNLVNIIKDYNPLAIIPGAEGGVPLAEALTNALTPEFSNQKASINHLHKADMQKALMDAGLPFLKTIHSDSEKEVTSWLEDQQLADRPLIVKPPISAGSEKVFHIAARGDWKTPFREILHQASNITGQSNQTVVVQEQAKGTEFALGTVSANGIHYLAHLIKYNKISYNGRDTIYDHVEFVPYDEKQYGAIFEYTKKSLNALGIRWGASHNEIMLTDQGPRLIESAPRMCGGPVVRFAREATGSSQADKLVELFVDGDVKAKDYILKKSVVPVFLKSPIQGKVQNAEVLNAVDNLPTLFKKFIWFKNGDLLPQTIDYLTSIGIIALSGERQAIFEDYKKIRQMEKQLVVKAFS